jgi:ribosomal protein L37E
MAGRPVVSKVDYPPHVFAPKASGPRDWNDQPTECEVCGFPKPNGVHKTSEELVADLPPKPPEDRSDQITGERDYDPEPQSTKE